MVEHTDSLTRRPRRLLGLFEEAWRRQRRRRSQIALVAVSVLIACAALLRMGTSPSPKQIASPVAAGPQLASGGLPAAGHFASLVRVGGHLIVTGGPGGWPLNAPGAVTRLAHGRATGRCTAAMIVPHTIRLERTQKANCGDPALYGAHVLPIMFLEPSRQQLMIGVRIAVADRRARDGYRLGPTVASYAQCSDCGAQWILGNHALWINVPLTHGYRGPGEVLRISTATGRVLQRFAMPQLVRALLAVNENGLWIAPSIETGEPDTRVSRRVQRQYESLYLIVPGTSRAREELYVGSGGVPWLAAAGQRVWLQEEPTGHFSRILTFTGAHPSRIRRGPRQRVGADWGTELGEGPVPFVASPTSGVDAVVAPNSDQQQIVNYNPTTLTEHVLATLPRPGAQDETTTTITDGDALYFLDPRLTLASGTAPAQLYRFDTH
ncbi:MAG TPA: hypothetical protein VIK04_20155 [Solirubrobacteraceae bacterium]